ncbi:MAG: pilus assembly protein TadE [Pseudonocardiaceae bacterium]|nr:pilus assembly protein TadE [Pseudonocardiaceae bacterium]
MMPSRRRDDRGASAVEFVLVIPVVVGLFLTGLQLTVRSYAESAAEDAADEGAAVARRLDGTAAGGRDAAQTYIDQLAADTLTDVTVSASRNGETASVTVSGATVAVIPFVNLTVSKTSTGPVERYVPEEAPE